MTAPSITIGIQSYGVYVPCGRLARSAIGEALGGAVGRGTRSVAAHDQDSVALAVEAARIALRALAGEPDRLTFATSSPPYVEKDNAATIHAALGLPSHVPAHDAGGSLRAATGSLDAALDRAARGGRSVWVAADVRSGLPGSVDESSGGDGAVAFVVGAGPDAVAELVGTASRTEELLDRWRLPGSASTQRWEERFAEHAYLGALPELLLAAGVDPTTIDVIVVTGASDRAARSAAAVVGARRVADDLVSSVGNCGVAHPGLLLALAIDEAAPGEVIAQVVLGDGVDVRVWRVLPGCLAARQGIRSSLEFSRQVSYASYLTWRDHLHREPPRRPEPEGPVAPAARRSAAWKYSFTASRCRCGTRHLPPQRVCLRCKAVDEMLPERLADATGTVATFAVDRLAPTPAPPVAVAVVDFDGGGRYLCELTDTDQASLAIGDRVAMTFRRLHSSGGIHNYFWKATKVLQGQR